MSHMAGLHYFDTPVTEEMARDHNLMRKIIEDESTFAVAMRNPLFEKEYVRFTSI
ncbi:unnamed protein product [Cylicostephanus goldi]|uniref:Uncharacterized protein n=1 Tax=Cylicostephanus goldi TaxID=71465 RepID=A0A3P7N8W6_CYLGO|nr:unnamed protein product [Cylicostephanus goldi]